MTPEQWIVGDDTGTSSKTIWAVMMGVQPYRPSPPRDPADLGRCLRLLGEIPEWLPRLKEVASAYTEWQPLVDHWGELASLYYEELPVGTAPKCYARMKELRQDS